jgi:hypothetical protein
MVSVPVSRKGTSARASHPVGLGGDRGPEAEGACEGQLRRVESGHHVAGAAPAIDGLGGVADHDQLGVVPLGGEDVFEDGVGVLGFVEEEEVCLDLRPGQGPHFQVVIMLEADHSALGVL